MISIILPTYNCAEYLDRSINSVLRQSYSNWELIIIDDGSQDNTKEICEYYCSSYINIRYIYQENQGVSSARNKGISISNGSYICFLDADDYYDKRFLEYLHEKIKGYEIAYVGFKYKNKRSIRDSIKFNYIGNILKPYLYSISEQEHPFCICSILVKKELLLNNNIQFSNGVKNCEDTEFIINILDIGSANGGEEHLFTYQQERNGSATTSNTLRQQIFSILNTFKRLYLSTSDDKKSNFSYVIKKEIDFWLIHLLKNKLRKNIKLIIEIIIWKIKNRKIL